MARDSGLEELMREQLADISGLAERPMFGGLAWLLHGHLLCAARKDGALFRLGKGNDAEALKIEGITPMVLKDRAMHGWVWVSPELMGDDAIAQSLLASALAFIRSLPEKK
ncbi:MAG: TfoX/Sxy family protein [Micavibrio sp.]|nr:TfoX/Sxy family protein [Micavibrio sp.]